MKQFRSRFRHSLVARKGHTFVPTTQVCPTDLASFWDLSHTVYENSDGHLFEANTMLAILHLDYHSELSGAFTRVLWTNQLTH